MTSKEKAEELFIKYSSLLVIPRFELAKQSALIAVDEILEVTGGHINQFYQQVRVELTNL